MSAVNLDLAAEQIADWIRGRTRAYVCVAPVSTVVRCQEDPEYLRVVNGAGMVTPDGMPVAWLARLKGYRQVRRTYGPDFMLKVCDEGQERGYRHYLFGGSEAVLHKLEERLRARFPLIRIAGAYAPPFQEWTREEKEEMVDSINAVDTDILWVGLGSPKQDFWMAEHRDRINAPVMVGVGAAFDFLSGSKPQAPRWMQRSGLEWLFRLACEPRRLGRRYLVGNTKFVLLIIRGAFRGSLFRRKHNPGETRS